MTQKCGVENNSKIESILTSVLLQRYSQVLFQLLKTPQYLDSSCFEVW